jgi:hypothetical protein
MLEDLEVADIDELLDRYQEMVAMSSPTLDGIPQEEMDGLKVHLQTMDWNALSGRSWYAAKRFLSTISQAQLQDSLRGSSSTNSSTTTSE